ncbi:hypothetical protein ACFE04_013683 [Oxalis oulophora]
MLHDEQLDCICISEIKGKIGTFTLSFTVVLLGFTAYCGFCDELPMVSVPLGFQISGFDDATTSTTTWVSQNGAFAFGFLDNRHINDNHNNDNDDGYVVGIRYNLRNNYSSNLPVWTVSGGLRVSRNSSFKLSLDGRLILFDNPSGLIVWSSNTSTLGVNKATLLNNGNLILMDTGNRVVWESFQSPTTTLLPGQLFRFPQSLRAPSANSISSYYSLVMRRSGELALVWQHNMTYWTTCMSFNGTVKEARFDSDGVLGLFDATNKSIWSVKSLDFRDPSVGLRHLRIDSDGNLRMYSWDNVADKWRIGWQAVENQCDVFGSCGLYSVCGYNSTGPVCDCLSSIPETDSGSFGCQKMVDLANCKTHTSMTLLEKTVLHGFYGGDVDVMMLSEKACKHYCSNDSSCTAATFKDDGSGVCTVQRSIFISGYRNPSVPATSFLKVCLVPLAASAQKPPPQINAYPSTTLSDDRPGSINIGALALIVLVTVSGFLTTEVLVLWFIYRRRQTKTPSRIPFGKDAEINAHYSGLIRLSFEEIMKLTANFATPLSPSVYKGFLQNDIPVIVKVLKVVVATEKDFRVMASTLGGMHHRNLVLLKGFCFEAKHMSLLYGYVPNSLDRWLFNIEKHQNERTWQQKLDIALGVARALAYLHKECPTNVAHGNLKLENVLLDEILVPKVTDFGLQSLLQNDAASSSESLFEKDIYNFGEMLLQIMTSKRDFLGQQDLHQLADNIIDELQSENKEDSEGVERVVRIALWCMQKKPFLRPSIDEVVKVIEGTISVDRPPSAFPLNQAKMDE